MSKAICNVPGCGCMVGLIETTSFRRGGRSIWYCPTHAASMQQYSTRNNTVSGKAKVNPFTFGVELETSHSTLKARAELFQNQFIATSDCTVDVEYKSPIYNGLNALSKQAETIDRLMQMGELEIGSGCGTHVHVGVKGELNSDTMGWIRRFYNSLFVALSDEMRAHTLETVKLFGRDFTHYAQPVNMGSYAEEHTNFINVQHSNTIEFRLVKFRNAKQFMACVKFARDCANTIMANFVEHFNDDDYDHNRYQTITAYRKHKAQVAAQKMVKLFHKYAATV